MPPIIARLHTTMTYGFRSSQQHPSSAPGFSSMPMMLAKTDSVWWWTHHTTSVVQVGINPICPTGKGWIRYIIWRRTVEWMAQTEMTFSLDRVERYKSYLVFWSIDTQLRTARRGISLNTPSTRIPVTLTNKTLEKVNFEGIVRNNLGGGYLEGRRTNDWIEARQNLWQDWGCGIIKPSIGGECVVLKVKLNASSCGGNSSLMVKLSSDKHVWVEEGLGEKFKQTHLQQIRVYSDGRERYIHGLVCVGSVHISQANVNLEKSSENCSKRFWKGPVCTY